MPAAAEFHAALLAAPRSGPSTQRSHLDQMYDTVRLARAEQVSARSGLALGLGATGAWGGAGASACWAGAAACA